MEESYSKLNMSEPAVFRICIQGELDESWFEYFAAQSVSVEKNEAGETITAIISELLDQGALLGLVNGLNGLGIPLISVEPVRF